MATTTQPPSDLEALETEVLENLDTEAGNVEESIDSAGSLADLAPQVEAPNYRVAIAVAFPTIAAAVMVGGIFEGASPRVYAAVAGVLGVGLGVIAGRIKRPMATLLTVGLGAFIIGALMVIPSGAGNVGSLVSLVRNAANTGDLLRPPVPLTAGWQAILGWMLGLVGFTAAWVGITLNRPALALMLPLPVAAVAGISVPDEQQAASGIVALVLFVVGLGVLSSAAVAGEGDERAPVAFEVRRALRSIPLIAVVTIGLVLLAQTDFLFPATRIDPASEPQRPKTVPLSEVQDRILFEVRSSLTGPWRIGSLDVYDGKEWRLAPFSESRLKEVPRDGFVDRELAPGVRATFTVRGLTGAVLPGLSNTVGIIASGPKLGYDDRTGSIRLPQGTVQPDLEYEVAAAALPKVEELTGLIEPMPASVTEFTEIPAPPPGLANLLDQATDRASLWEQFDFLRNFVLDTVTAAGAGIPKAVPPERVEQMLTGPEKEGTPFEIVAAQAMLARWVGLPSRIGYGFDGGEQVGGRFQVHPRHGATFVEVYFPGFKWLPVVGTPRKAKPTVGSDPGQQQTNPNILPSDEVQVNVFLPLVQEPASVLGKQLLRLIVLALPVVAALLLFFYVIFPLARKGSARSRRRAAAVNVGPRARVALAYAEWRDVATDFGFGYPTDTPLMYLDRFIDDAEHTELAWLTTRVLWGDLQETVSLELAVAAEELSRSLRRRLSNAQPSTVRFVASVSRLSLKDPFAPDLDAYLEQTKEAADEGIAA